MFVCCECWLLSVRGLCDRLITRPEESYRLWLVVVCDQETLNEEAKPCYGAVENTTKRVVTSRKQKQHQQLFLQLVECGVYSVSTGTWIYN
jgi:hypothetical protein